MEKIAFLLLFIVVGNCAALNSCTSVGKFIADSNCTSYVVCSKIDTQFTSYTIQCPPGFIVRQPDMICSMSGTHCEPSYTCTSLGNFTNPMSMNSSVYISCIQGIGEKIIPTVLECPASLEFNALAGRCELKTFPTVSVLMANDSSPPKIQVETVTEVVSPTTQVKTNSSVNMMASCYTVAAAISAFLLFYKFYL